MMKYLKGLFAVLIVGSLIVWGFSVWRTNSFSTTAESRLALMDRMEQVGLPEIKGIDLNGQEITSKSFAGKVVIVNFWASWCAPCLEEFPSMIKLVKEFKGDVILVAVSQDSNRADIDAFLKSFPEGKDPAIHVVWDEKRDIGKAYEVDRLPESFLAGKDGKLVTKIVGTINWYSDESVAYIREILAK